MHKSRRIIALITALMFLFSFAAPAMANTAGNYSIAIEAVTAVGAMVGYANGSFGENDTFTRAQAATVMARISGYEPNQAATTKSGFIDVANTHWASDAVAWAVKAGVAKGYPDGTFKPDGQVTYREMAAMLIRVLGYGDYVEAGLGWPLGYDVAAAELGLVSRVYAANPNAAAIRGEVALATAIAVYDVTKADGTMIIFSVYKQQDPVTLDAAKKAVAAYEAAPLTTLAEVAAVEALKTAAADAIAKVTDAAEKTALTAKVTAQTATVAATKVALTPLAVESVSAVNNKQVVIKFNKPVDKVTAETAANYTVGGVAFGKAVLQADNMTVMATMAGDTKMTNAGTAEIKVLKNIKAANNVALAADYSVTIKVVDTTVPSVVGVEAVGAKTLKITFSEPVYDAGADTTLENDQITVKSGIYTYVVTNAVADYANRTVTVTVGTNLIEGDLQIKVNAPGMSDGEAIRDFAGLVLIPAELTYSYAKDTTVATATLTSVNKATKVAKVTFSKPVYGTDVKLYHSVNGEAAYGTAPVTKSETDAATNWEFTFTSALPSGALTFFLVNDTVVANQLTDLYGVKIPNQTFTYAVVADTTAPTVSTVTVNTNASIDIKFSEAVDAASIVAANFEILKPDGTALAFTPSVLAADTARLTAELADNTTYTITVKAMKDVAGNGMAAAYSVQKTVADNLNPTVASSYVVGNDKIYINFSEGMNEAQMLNKANYTVNAAALAAADTITLVSAKKIKITIAAANLAGNGTDDVVIGAITDLAGKKLTNDATFSTAVDNIVVAALGFTARATAVNKIKLVFDKDLGSFDAAEFSIRQADDGAASPAYKFLAIESNTVNTDGVSEVVLVLDTNLKANATDATGLETLEVLVTANGNTKSTEGIKLTNSAEVALADKIAPTVASVVFLSPARIEVKFTEALEADFFAIAGNNGFSVTGGTLTSAKLLTPDADGNFVILTGTDFTVNTDVMYNGTNGLKDVAGNTLAASTRTDALSTVGVVLGATAETTAGVAEVLQVATREVTGVATTAGNITVDGVNVAVATTDNLSAIATNIAGAALTNWTATADVAVLTFTAKVGAPNAEVTFADGGTGVTMGPQANTTDGVAAVAEVGTTTVTAGAINTANITINVADGTLNKDVIVAVAAGDTAAQVAAKIQTALAADTNVTAGYAVTVDGANVILTQKAPTSNVNLQVTLK
jgi:hypothetical protein